MMCNIKNYIYTVLFWLLYYADYTCVFNLNIICVFDDDYNYNQELTLKLRAAYLLSRILKIPFSYELLYQFFNIQSLNFVWWNSKLGKRLTMLDLPNKRSIRTEKYSNIIDIDYERSYDAQDCEDYYGNLPVKTII